MFIPRRPADPASHHEPPQAATRSAILRGMTETAVLALRLAAREQGATAAELAKEAGISVRAAQMKLRELLGAQGALGTMTRERQAYGPQGVSPGQSPGSQPWVYHLQRH